MGEKEFIWGSKQIGQNYLRKVQESDRVNRIKLRVKAAVIANVVEFF